MRVLAALTILSSLVAASCGGKKDPAPTGDDQGSAGKTDKPDKPDGPKVDRNAPKGTARPQPKLTITLDGKPVTAQAAFAWKTSYGTVKVEVSSLPYSCEQVTSDMRMIQPDEVTFDVEVATQLQPDGSLKPALTSTYFDGSTHQQTLPTTGTGDGTEGKPTAVDVDFEATGTKGSKLVVKGSIDAIGCAPRKGPPPAALPAEMPASITVAGKKLPIRNAMIEPGTFPALVLTTGGETCAHSMNEPAGEFKLRLVWFKKDKPDVGQVDLGGSMLPNASDQTYDKKKITVDPAPPDKITQVKVHAEITVNKYPVVIDGTVMPQVCSH